MAWDFTSFVGSAAGGFRLSNGRGFSRIASCRTSLFLPSHWPPNSNPSPLRPLVFQASSLAFFSAAVRYSLSRAISSR